MSPQLLEFIVRRSSFARENGPRTNATRRTHANQCECGPHLRSLSFSFGVQSAATEPSGWKFQTIEVNASVFNDILPVGADVSSYVMNAASLWGDEARRSSFPRLSQSFVNGQSNRTECDNSNTVLARATTRRLLIGTPLGIALPCLSGGNVVVVFASSTHAPVPSNSSVSDSTATLIHELGHAWGQPHSGDFGPRGQRPSNGCLLMANGGGPNFFGLDRVLCTHEIEETTWSPVNSAIPSTKRFGPCEATWIRRPVVDLCTALRKELVAPDALVRAKALSIGSSVKWVRLDQSDPSSNLPFTKISLQVSEVVRARAGVSVPTTPEILLLGSVSGDELRTSGEGPLRLASTSDGIWGLKHDGNGGWYLQSGLLFWTVADRWNSDWQFINESIDTLRCSIRSTNARLGEAVHRFSVL